MSQRPPPGSHRDLLTGAKQQQAAHLQTAAAASAQLIRAVESIVRVNSATAPLARTVLLDKVATIHELDAEIDRQLAQDIAENYEALLAAKQKLARHVTRTQRALAMLRHSAGSCVDVLQLKAELIDQELRVLETALSYINNQD
ncbi:hypothetical protein METBIDRAFT_39444 [Metschnikowia bicuspidata var. bicuspidata NRRL YB-4993]|uniref:Uncharacterized protein n=1 Tax=Metschnikowia bicuspidata var. bicuspidata NRRL YB-4993 TaxID=869754 RepID=A0A1A0HEW9_9ASCO|nr:hypothetical protein METBIDRAFT_39444 [Metschnikowia bicuspidata var. bicuspidata NRRL YB-4993]OBA22520.1 hypothetical protein METBIDRAFT_39444 [Metschnikowia bicuspidata var. bicuspidata NRRL YB-4993]